MIITTIILIFLGYICLSLAYLITKNPKYWVYKFNLYLYFPYFLWLGCMVLLLFFFVSKILLLGLGLGVGLIHTLLGLGFISLTECLEVEVLPSLGSIASVSVSVVNPESDPNFHPPIFVELDHNGEKLIALVIHDIKGVYYSPDIGFCGYKVTLWDWVRGKTEPTLCPYLPYYDSWFDSNGVFYRIPGPDEPHVRGEGKGFWRFAWDYLSEPSSSPKKTNVYEDVNTYDEDHVQGFSESVSNIKKQLASLPLDVATETVDQMYQAAAHLPHCHPDFIIADKLSDIMLEWMEKGETASSDGASSDELQDTN